MVAVSLVRYSARATTRERVKDSLKVGQLLISTQLPVGSCLPLWSTSYCLHTAVLFSQELQYLRENVSNQKVRKTKLCKEEAPTMFGKEIGRKGFVYSLIERPLWAQLLKTLIPSNNFVIARVNTMPQCKKEI